jgi:hypothetical protein
VDAKVRRYMDEIALRMQPTTECNGHAVGETNDSSCALGRNSSQHWSALSGHGVWCMSPLRGLAKHMLQIKTC